MQERESYRELILVNIEYDYLIQNRQLDRDRLDELVELMVDTVCSRRECPLPAKIDRKKVKKTE